MVALDVFYTRVGTPTRVYAAAPAQLNFQARLLGSNGAIVADGTYSVEFKLYDTQSGGSATWTETQNVQVRAGYLSVYLGDVTPFSGIDWSQQQWLTMNVNGDGEMSPRLRLTSVPSAFRADQADALKNGSGSLTADGIAQLAPSNIQAVNSALAALRINQTGAGFLAQLQNNGSDVFTIAGNGSLTSAGNGTFSGGTLNLGSLTQAGSLVLHDGAGQYATLQTASLTSNRTYTFPDADGVVCLTTTCGGAANSFITGGNSFGGLAILGTNDTYGLAFETDGQQRVLIDANGNFGIGTTGTLSTLFAVGGTTGNLTIASSGDLNTTGTVTSAGVTSNGALSVTSGGASITGNSSITGTLGVSSTLTVSAGGLAVTGNSTINGTLTGLTGLTVASGGASITGGLNNNNGGITNAGSITGVGSNITATGALAIASTGANNLNLTSGSGTVVLGATNLQTTSTLGVDLNNASDTNLNLQNTGTGVANLNLVDGALMINGTAVITNTGVLQNVTASTNILTSGTLGVQRGGTGLASVIANGVLYGAGTSALNVATGSNGQVLMLNGSGVPTFTTFGGDVTLAANGTVTVANGAITNAKLANSSITINTSGNIVGGTVALGGTLTVSTVNNPTFSTSVTTPSLLSSGALNITSGGSAALTLTSASNAINLNTSSGTNLTLNVASGASNSTLTVTNSGSGVASLVVEGGITAGNGTFNLSATGDITATMIQLDGSSTTTGGSGLTTSTSLALTSAASFDVGNYVRVTAANCGGTGINPCYAKITAKATNTLTITPALRWTVGSAVVEFHIPEIGGTNTADALANRYGRGYFISGVATGNGTTYYSEEGITTSLSNFAIETSDAAGNIAIGTMLGGSGTVSIGNAGTATTIYGNVTYTGNVTAPTTGTAGYLQRSGTTISPSNAGDNFTTSGNISTSGSGTITSAGSLTVSSGGADISGNTTISGTLTGLTGLTVASGGFNVTGNSTLTGTLSGLTGLTVASGGANITGNTAITGTASIYSAGYNVMASSASLNAYGYFRSVDSGDAASRFELGAYDISGASQGGRDLILNQLGGNVAIGTTTTAGLFSVGVGNPFQVSSGGVITAPTSGNTINGLIINAGALSGITTINTSGGLTIGGNSTINGTLSGLTGLTVASGGASITGGINANNGSITGVGSNLTGTGALTVGSGGSGTLTLDSANNILTIAASDTTLQRIAAGNYTVDLRDTGATTLVLDNSNTGVADLKLNDGSLYIGSSQVLTNGRVLQNLTGLTVASGGASIAGNTTITGTLTGLTGLTVASGGFSVTGNSTLTGTLSGLTGLTVASGGANITGNSTVTGTLSSTSRFYVPGTSGTNGQGFFVGNATTHLGGFQSLDLSGSTYSLFATNKYYNGSAWVDNGLGRTGSSFQIQNDNFTFYSFDTATNFTPRFTVASGGNVGIGVTGAPGALLSVGGITGNFQVSSLGAITAPTTTNTINSLIINAGALSGITTLNMSGLLTGTGGLTLTGAVNINTGGSTGAINLGGGSAPLTINSTAFDVTSAGAVSGVTTLNTSGNITTGGIYRIGAQNGMSISCGNSQSLDSFSIVGGITVSGTCQGYLSDARLKQNVASLDDSILEGIKRVNTVNFDYDCTKEVFAPAGGKFGCEGDRQTGVIAQELAEIFPELVYLDPDVGYYQVNYDALNIYTLKAVGQLAEEVDAMDLSSINGLNVSGGGASVVGGLNNNGGGITNTGALDGVTFVNAQNVSLTGGTNGKALTLTKDGNGVFTIFNNGALEMKLDSANAFAIKDAANNSILNVDSASGKISLGGAGKTVLLTFGIKDTMGDPAGINGSEYYNSAMGKFRCYQNNRWMDCLPVTNASYVLGDRVESWTQPLTDTELPGEYRTWIDLTNAREFRLIMRVTGAGSQGAACHMQYANTDNGPWATLGNANAKLDVDQTGTLKADWAKIEDAANKEVLVRVVCSGNANGNPAPVLNFSSMSVQLR